MFKMCPVSNRFVYSDAKKRGASSDNDGSQTPRRARITPISDTDAKNGASNTIEIIENNELPQMRIPPLSSLSVDKFRSVLPANRVVVRDRGDVLGKSLFAAEDIKLSEPVAFYSGVVIKDPYGSSDKGSRYIVSANQEWGVEGDPALLQDKEMIGGYTNSPWQMAPNDEWVDLENVIPVFMRHVRSGAVMIVLVATQPIAKGREVYWHYGSDYFVGAEFDALKEQYESGAKPRPPQMRVNTITGNLEALRWVEVAQ